MPDRTSLSGLPDGARWSTAAGHCARGVMRGQYDRAIDGFSGSNSWRFLAAKGVIGGLLLLILFGS